MGLLNAAFEKLPPALRLRIIAAQQPLREPEIRICKEALGPGSVAVDVGAWWGAWSSHMARHADRVITLEPIPYVVEALRSSLPDNVEVREVAASDVTGRATLWLPAAGVGAEGRSSLTSPTPESNPIDVATTRIDDLDLDQVDLLKIDVEGHEMAVFDGARATIERHRPVLVIELEQRFHDQPLAACFAEIESLGYTGSYLDGDDWLPTSEFDVVRWQEEHQDAAGNQGFIASIMLHKKYKNNFVFRPLLA